MLVKECECLLEHIQDQLIKVAEDLFELQQLPLWQIDHIGCLSHKAELLALSMIAAFRPFFLPRVDYSRR